MQFLKIGSYSEIKNYYKNANVLMTILLFFTVYQIQSSKQNQHQLQSTDAKSFLLNAFQVLSGFVQSVGIIP